MATETTKGVASRRLWWESLEQECPITLEPLCELPYPPFPLSRDLNNNQQREELQDQSEKDRNDVYYFDGLALASYIVSRGIFQNPLTREPLSRNDCQRLDDYLDLYGDYNHDTSNNLQRSGRRFGVLEAFALYEALSIQTTSHDSSNNDRQRRAEVLRREATTALLGLFEYAAPRNHRGNRNHNQRPRQNRTERALNNNPLGFNLNQSLVDTTTNNYQQEGIEIIDDDEAILQESIQENYRQLQEAFPHLSTTAAAQTSSNQHLQQFSNTSALQAIKNLAEQEELQAKKQKVYLEEANRQLQLQAKQKRESRIQEQKKKSQANHQLRDKQRQELEEQALARAEIEQWRQEHWDKLVALQQEQEREQQLKQEKQDKEEMDAQEKKMEAQQDLPKQEAEPDKPAIAAAARQAKADKRRRAKERKKAKQKEEKARLEKERQQAERKAQEEASAKRCSACDKGILGYGFEKLGHHFCSPKCARSGPRE